MTMDVVVVAAVDAAMKPQACAKKIRRVLASVVAASAVGVNVPGYWAVGAVVEVVAAVPTVAIHHRHHHLVAVHLVVNQTVVVAAAAAAAVVTAAVAAARRRHHHPVRVWIAVTVASRPRRAASTLPIRPASISSSCLP